MTIEIGMDAPTFMLPDQNDETVSLGDFSGRWLVLYFYPKDMTPGCTVEAIDFTNAKNDFAQHDCEIIGVSPDSPETHCKFIAKENLMIQLLSDEDKKILEAYGVWQEKSMFGKKYMGVVRTTVLIDPSSKVAHVWEKVKVKDHVKEVLEKLEVLRS
jgi:thioredoxin-dependent peroxiredoxin